MIKKNFDILLIFLGCTIIVIAVSLKLYTHYEQKKLVDDYRKYIIDMDNKDKSYNMQKQDLRHSLKNERLENQDKSGDRKKTSKTQKHNIIGILSIPKIDLCVGIGEGVDMDTLKYSVGHFTETALPGKKGNVCLIGHRSYSYGEFFNRLNEMKKGDLFYIENNRNKFTYKVTKIKVVKPENVSVLNQTKDAEITLITCTPIRVGTHRLIIKGVLVHDKIINHEDN